jgi:hypothetical protein
MKDEPNAKIKSIREALSEHPMLWEFIKCVNTDDNLHIASGKDEENESYVIIASPTSKIYTFKKTDKGYTVEITENPD